MALGILILLSVLFAGTHLALSHGRLRETLVQKLGALGFRVVYSLIAVVTLGSAGVILAGNRHLGPELFSTPGWLYPVIYLLTFLSFLLIVLSLANPSPTGLLTASLEPRGVLRVTRHPVNMGLASFALAHLLANGYLGDVFFFGSIFVVGFFGAYHQDRRKAREKGEPFLAFQDQTSILPFASLIRGKTKLPFSEISFPLLLLGLAAWLILLLFHKKFFGVAPF